MEHLPLPEGVNPFIIVPYHTADPQHEWYSGPSHEEYPEKMGWSEHNLCARVRSGRNDPPFGTESSGNPRKNEDIEHFFQTWLFFGTAIEVLKLGGVDVTTEDFLQPIGLTKARIVTTEKLPSLLMKWDPAAIGSDIKASEDPVLNAQVNKSNDQSTLWRKTERILGRTLFYLNLFCQPPKERHPSDRRKTPTWPVRDEISTSIIALVFAFLKAAEQKCVASANSSTENLKIYARSATLCKRLERKWCLADATKIEDEMEIDGHYYLAASPGLSEDELDHHINCARDRCHYNMDEGLYVTKHAPAPWHHENCKPGIWAGFGGSQKIGTATSWFDSVCKVLQADSYSIPLVLWSAEHKKFLTVEYHTDDNSKLKPDFVAISHVWSDGKGNPNGNSLPECQLARIQDMVAKVRYEGRKPPVEAPHSDGVGFWMDTMCIPQVGGELRKKAIAGMRDVYKNAKCVLILDEWLMQIPSTSPAPVILTRMFQSNWIKRLWTHQEGFFPQELFVQFSDCSVKLDDIGDSDWTKAMVDKGIYTAFTNVALMRLVLQYGLFKFGFLSMSQTKDQLWMLYKPLSHNMSVRQTSRKADECVCIATVLSLDVRPFLNINDKPDAESATERMALLLKTIEKFESGIIFNSWERLQVPGLRWAPRSLLGHIGQKDEELGNGWPVEIQWNSDGTAAGLPVKFPGFSSFNFSSASRKSVVCADRAFGVQPGPGSGEFPWHGDWPLYIVEVAANEVVWDWDKQYAVILANIPRNDSDGLSAVIGEAVTGVEEVNTFRHLCLAVVRPLREGEDPEWIDIITTDVLLWGTKWLVK